MTWTVNVPVPTQVDRSPRSHRTQPEGLRHPRRRPSRVGGRDRARDRATDRARSRHRDSGLQGDHRGIAPPTAPGIAPSGHASGHDVARSDLPSGQRPEAPPAPAVDPWSTARDQLERAREYRRRLDAGEVESQAALARAEGMSRARVTQVMRLLDLAPEIQRRIERDRSSGRGLAQTALRRIAMLEDHQEQLAAFAEALGEQPSPGDRSRHREAPRPRGFQHLFDRARRYRAMLDADPALTLGELGAMEGITGVRVGQVLALLHLAPQIIAALDVPVEQVPEGITYGEVRRLARVRDRGEQLRRFWGMVKP
jgi:hypothetical protein